MSIQEAQEVFLIEEQGLASVRQRQHGGHGLTVCSEAIVCDTYRPEMAPSNPLANWEKLGDSFYRKIPIYDAVFDEEVELENYIVAGAPYGGAIGTTGADPVISGGAC